MKLTWEAVTECDDEETGEHTCWSAEINHPQYGRFVWITILANRYHVEYYNNGFFKTLANCASLESAKRWANNILNLI